MVKRIYPNHMVAHIWANQSQDSARSSNGNVSFDGATLYSYAATIGRITTGVDGRTVILISDGTHHYNSNTTSRHISRAHGAAHDHGAIFYVPSIGNNPDHTENLAKLVENYRASVARLHRMRDNPSEWQELHATELATLALDYAAAFGLDAPAIDSTADLANMLAFRAEREARLNTPERIAKRERDNLRRVTLRAEREARQLAAAREAGSKALAEWRAGQSVYLPYGAQRDEQGGALLRIRGDKLETSMGASVPLGHAIAAFRRIAACREAGISWKRNGGTIRVGHFQIDQINPDGSFRAGCHLINWPEVDAAAKIVGVATLPVHAGA